MLGKLTNGLAGVTTGATNASANETIALTARGIGAQAAGDDQRIDAPRRTSAVRLIVSALGCKASALALR